MKKLSVLFLLIASSAQAGLLTGMTPSNYTIPSGWTLLRTQGFESGCNGDEDCGRNNGTITTTRAHSGTHSVGGTYTTDQSEVGWKWYYPNTGSYNEIYVSFYEYNDTSTANQWNDEYFLFNLMKKSGDDIIESWITDWYWARDSGWNLTYNGAYMTLYNITESVGGGGVEWTDYSGGVTAQPPANTWTQWEIHWKANTVGQSDGFARVYKNGTLYVSSENKNTRGTVDMSNPDFILVGGLYTRLAWMLDYPTCNAPSQCSAAPGDGTDACMGLMDWWWQTFAAPKCGPTTSNFSRYLDDIIVMKLVGTSGGPDVQPPFTYGHTPAKSATQVPAATTSQVLHIADNRTDDQGVVLNTISVLGPNGTKTCSGSLTCTGGPADYTVTYSGLSLSNDQVVNWTVSAQDGAGNPLSENFSWTVEPASPTTLNITTASLPNGTVGTAYSQTMAAEGGTPSYTWAVISGALPTGLTMDTSGNITGTPTTAETANPTIQVTDSQTATDNQAFTITINASTPGGGTSTTITSITDTYINSGSPWVNTNYETSTELRTYVWPYLTTANRILIDVDISSLPANVTINSATLELYLTGYDSSGGDNPMTIYVYRVASMPDLTTVTWTNFNGVLQTSESSASVNLVSGYKSWNVTNATQWAYANSSHLYLALDSGSVGAQSTNRIFASMDHATSAWRPKLGVTYTSGQGGAAPPPSAPAPGKMRISRGVIKSFH